MTWMDIAVMWLLVTVYIGGVYALTTWAIRDGEARGTPGWAVACLALFLFPIGPVIWVLLRPPLLSPVDAEPRLDLQRFRVQ